jgi:hypothetical protein
MKWSDASKKKNEPSSLESSGAFCLEEPSADDVGGAAQTAPSGLQASGGRCRRRGVV